MMALSSSATSCRRRARLSGFANSARRVRSCGRSGTATCCARCRGRSSIRTTSSEEARVSMHTPVRNTREVSYYAARRSLCLWQPRHLAENTMRRREGIRGFGLYESTRRTQTSGDTPAALLHRGGRLVFAGRAGTGMHDAELKRLFGSLKSRLEIKTMPRDAPSPRKSRLGSFQTRRGLLGEAQGRRSSAESQLDG